ncbi:hypothetical protein EVAR_75652_1 [Eumeta japonica]|uniref:Reverse transcriptase domain-containing protein n=1 Tax=Eumeta variegata TaxID=151549 RepID=A0A4C1U0C2_EUMVA|nr:hypothetical protein EVAR_75652_1 [Eumeta japonica]
MGQREIIEKQVQQMLDSGVIKHSKSPYAFSVVLVKKPDDTWIFCVDFRNLNKKVIADSYPIPRIEDLLMYLGKAKHFPSLDLISGYWQMVVAEKDRSKTAFVTPSGIFEFTVVPYGLKTSQANFQRMMDTVLAGIKYRNAIVYVDDVVVYGETFEEFCNALRDVLNRFRKANLMVKSLKCSFGYESVTVLGYENADDKVLTRLFVDASGEVLGASLMQGEWEQKEMYPDSNEVKTVEEEIELTVYRISAETLMERQRVDEFCRRTVEALVRNGGRYRDFLLRNEVLYKRIEWLGHRKEVIVLPRCMLDDVLKEMHDEPWTGGHFGLTKTLAKLRERYFVKNAEKEVKKYITSCRVSLKRKKVSNQASLQPIVVRGILEKIGIDVVGPIRRSMRGGNIRPRYCLLLENGERHDRSIRVNLAVCYCVSPTNE